MESCRRSIPIGARVNEDQLVRIDAAARLSKQARAHFIVEAVVAKAEEVLFRAASNPAGLRRGGKRPKGLA